MRSWGLGLVTVLALAASAACSKSNNINIVGNDNPDGLGPAPGADGGNDSPGTTETGGLGAPDIGSPATTDTGGVGTAETETAETPKCKVGEGMAVAPKKVVAGSTSTCVLFTNGTAKCWGDNTQGQLGTGDTIASPKPVAVKDAKGAPLTTLTDLAVGSTTACAVTCAGKVLCWGNGTFGQIGNGKTDIQNPSPTEVVGLTDARLVEVGLQGSCAVHGSGATEGASCWGSNFGGFLGNGVDDSGDACGNTAKNCKSAPVRVSGPGTTIKTMVGLTVGNSWACVWAPNNVECWGQNAGGQRGYDPNDVQASEYRFKSGGLSTGPTFTEMSAGAGHTCAINNLKYVNCWGSHAFGQLGPTDLGQPPPDQELHYEYNEHRIREAFVAVAAGDRHSCAAHEGTGDVVCWGHNDYGQLGNNTIGGADECFGKPYCQVAPVEVKELANAKQLAAGENHTCALTTQGEVYCWGDNSSGQLGVVGMTAVSCANGSKTCHTIPVKVPLD